MITRLLFLMLIAQSTIAQSFKEAELTTSIKEVTVFLQGAQITRTGTLSLAVGKTEIVIRSLSPHIDEKSIQVKATGDFTILSVNHRLNYLNELKREAKIDSLIFINDAIQSQIDTDNARLDVLKIKLSLLNSNKVLSGQNSGVSLTQLEQAMDLFDRELTAIKTEELKINSKISDLEQEHNKLKKQINETRAGIERPSGEIVIRVNATKKVKGQFTISYLVANAGWFPKYNVRVKNVESPIELNYKADVYQNTGVDWKNVKLKFSNGNPNQSGVAPNLATWNLNYARYTIYQRKSYENGMLQRVGTVSGTVTAADDESTVPGVNVIVKGTTIGTVTDIDGNYSLTLPNKASQLVFSFVGYMKAEYAISGSRLDVQLESDIQQLEEVVVTSGGYGSSSRPYRVQSNRYRAPKKTKVVTTTTIENQTTVEFEVKTPYSIKSNGEKLTVDLTKYDIDAIYEYYAVPKLDKDAFLIARIVNWDKYNLLEGEANLYFEDAFVGRSILDAKALTDTLDISLGRDKNIVVGREKVDEYSKKRAVGSNKIDSRGFRIIARNKKSQPIKLTIIDQIPHASINDISVSADEISGGKLDEDTGKIIWELNLPSQKQKELILKYSVKYPKKEKVVLE